jgi:SAM domain (Sterile alpha motif)
VRFVWLTPNRTINVGDPHALGYAFGTSLCELHLQRAAMQQVADWLQKLGLGQYAQRFAENDISFVILPDLTDQDLEKIGVASLGHRRLLLRAITELKGGETVAPKLTNENIAPVAPHETAERRQVTVMFSDLE